MFGYRRTYRGEIADTAVTCTVRSNRNGRLDLSFDQIEPLSAQKGCGVARFVRVPGVRVGGKLHVSHSSPIHIPAATRRVQWALIVLQPACISAPYSSYLTL
jgi:hypothetical protein